MSKRLQISSLGLLAILLSATIAKPAPKAMKVIWRIREFARAQLSARLRTRYTRALEAEVERLRAENRALVNSILGVEGLPPMRVSNVARAVASDFSPDQNRQYGPKSCPNGSAGVDGFVRATLGSPGRGKPRPYESAGAIPRLNVGVSENASAGSARAESPLRSVRRRSWQQIGRALALEDARAAQRERESDTETFPAPRNVVPRN